jgi:leader peptidase (prepilin peptidase)/N-methyltransferase
MIYAIIIIIGLILGSFANSIIYRLPDLESIYFSRSECPKCKTKIRFWDLIPVLSYVVLRGHCRNCQEKISWIYPVVEIATAGIFLLIWLYFGFSVYAIFLMIFSWILIIVFVHDAKTMEISGQALLLLLLLLIIWTVWEAVLYQPTIALLDDHIWAGIIGGILWLILNLVSKGKWIGFGDFQLGFLLGFVLGLPNSVIFLFITAIIGGIVAIVLMALGKKHLKDKVALGPIMILAFFITLFLGQQLLSFYLTKI